MSKTYTWGEPTLLPDGHRLFPRYTESLNHVAIANDSGPEPQDTDDGILWLDRMRPLMVSGDNISIPLRSDNGHDTRTNTDVATMLLLAAMFDWPVIDMQNNTGLYSVKER